MFHPRWFLLGFYLLLIFLTLVPWDFFKKKKGSCQREKKKILHGTLMFLIVIHVMAGIGIIMIHHPKAFSIVYTIFLGIWFALSVTAGKHRLYTHQTYKAHPLLELFFVLGALTVPSASIQSWVETHKIHHRFSDTCKDPHYSDRNTFFYSHFGWIYRERDQAEEDDIKKEDLTHLYSNPFIRFQHKHHLKLTLLVQLVLFCLPLLWGDFKNCFWLSLIRIMLALNCQFTVNSLAHTIGDRPYDPSIRPTQNHLVSVLTFGEGYHNYHHLFPKDFRANDNFGDWNPTTWFLLFMRHMGLASDLKYFSKKDKTWKHID